MMTERKTTILVIDDDKALRDDLKNKLMDKGYEVTAASSGEEAVKLVADKPGDFDFSIIDQVLSPRNRENNNDLMDGIQTAEALLGINKDIGTIVYSGRSEAEKLARSKGVHRYIYKQGISSLEIIDNAIREMKRLQSIKAKMVEFFDRRQKMGLLFTGLNVGTALIDAQFRVWYTDDRFTEITGYSYTDPGLCHEKFHGFANGPCYGCPIKSIQNNNNPRTYFLNPFPRVGKLKFIYSRVESVFDEGQQPIAFVKSIVDVDESRILEGALDVNNHIEIVLKAIYAAGQNMQRGFRRIRLFRQSPNTEKLICTNINEAGATGRCNGESQTIALETIQSAMGAKKKRYRENDIKKISNGPALDFILGDETSPGWLVVEKNESRNPMDLSDLDVLKDYAEVLNKIIVRKESADFGSPDIDIASHLFAAQVALNNITIPEAGLTILLEKAIAVSGADMGHVRIVEGDQYRLIAQKGEYGDHALKLINAYRPSSSTARTILSRKEFVENYVQERTDITDLFSLPEGHELLNRIQSVISIPLRSGGKSIGIFKIMSFKPGNFDEQKIQALKKLEHLGTLVLQVYAHLKKVIAQNNKLALLDHAQRTVHNIRTPATAIRTYLDVLERDVGVENLSSMASAMEIIGKIKEQLVRIERLTSNMQRLLKPIAERKTTVDLGQLVEKTIRSNVGGRSDIGLKFTGTAVGTRVAMDADSFKEVIEELLQNALKAAKDKRKIKIDVYLEKIGPPGTGAIDLPQEGRCVVIYFQDNGPGVPEKIRDKIFDAWQSGSPHTSGLGLSVVKKIVEENGGTIWLADSGRKGAKFAIALPLQEPDDKRL